MAWLRVDDGFTEHRKVVSLRRADRWTWLELLTYCARQGNGGHVPEGITDVLRWVTPKFLAQCADLGLLDVDGDGYHVHDWTIYNPKDPTGAVRQSRHRNAKRNAEVTDDVTDCSVTEVTPPAQARARGPSPTPGSTYVEPLEIANRNETWDALTGLFGEAATETAKSLRGKIVRSLKGAGATPEQIARSRELWRRKMPPETTFTETALEKHWGFLFSEPRREVCEECGTGGGHHAAGCSRIVTDADISNVLREIHVHDR